MDRGAIIDGERLEQGFGLVAHLLAQLGGVKNRKLEDYLPRRTPMRERKPASIDEINALFTRAEHGK